MPNEIAKVFPLKFLSAINVGSDLKNVKNLFTIWLLTDTEYGVIQYVDNKKVIQDVADALVQDMVSSISVEEWLKLKYNATAAAYSDSKYDVYSSYSAATYSVAVAAYSDSKYDVYSSYSAAAYSVSSAVAAYYAAAAYSVSYAKSKWYIAASKKLIELLKQTN